MHRPKDQSLPAAWRGVASPRYMHLARWLALAEDLGGMPGGGPPGPRALEGVLNAQGYQAGNMNMTLMTVSRQTSQTDEVRDFVTARLTRHERLVLMLHYADGLDIDEIAEVLDLPTPTVAELLQRTLAAIQELLG